MKKLLAVSLAFVLFALSLGLGASARVPVGSTLNVMTYNVSGIPVIGDFQGTQREFMGSARMAKIGELMNSEPNCDLIGTQENFSYQAALAGALTDFPYQTLPNGRVPLGSGLTAFSKFPVYNVTHTRWEQSYGVLTGSTDRLAQKGILSTVIEIEDGVFIDFYVVHVEAGGDQNSSLARMDNFRQLAAMLNARVDDRAAIIVGDYNAGFVRRGDDGIYENLILPAGLKDCWAEICNNGNYIYNDGIGWNPTQGESVDRVMYKSGGGVELSAAAFEYIVYTNEKGQTYTDHIATKVGINYTITGNISTPEELTIEEPFDPFQRRVDEFVALIKTLYLVFTHLHELLELGATL